MLALALRALAFFTGGSLVSTVAAIGLSALAAYGAGYWHGHSAASDAATVATLRARVAALDGAVKLHEGAAALAEAAARDAAAKDTDNAATVAALTADMDAYQRRIDELERTTPLKGKRYACPAAIPAAATRRLRGLK